MDDIVNHVISKDFSFFNFTLMMDMFRILTWRFRIPVLASFISLFVSYCGFLTSDGKIDPRCNRLVDLSSLFGLLKTWYVSVVLVSAGLDVHKVIYLCQSLGAGHRVWIEVWKVSCEGLFVKIIIRL